MRSTQMSLQGHTYYMSPDQDVGVLKSDLIDAVRAGGDIVRFHSYDDQSEIEVLVSPGIPITFEAKQPSILEPESAEDIEYRARTVAWDEI